MIPARGLLCVARGALSGPQLFVMGRKYGPLRAQAIKSPDCSGSLNEEL
jgi:hypothetical protein